MLLVGTTSATGGTSTGPGVVGQVMVVNTTNPASPSVLETLTIPGMAVVTGISVQGNRALVIGSSQDWTNGVSGLGGDVVVAMLDLTNPSSPQVLPSQTTSVPSIGMSLVYSLGDGLYVTDSVAGPNQGAEILLLDASNPADVVVSQIRVPANINIGGFAVSGNDLFTGDGSNLFIYQIGAAPDTPVVAQVTVPTNNGVAIVPNSFSLAPTTITAGATSETLTWDLGFSAGNMSQTITWQSSVTGLQAGQSLTVAQGGTVQFTNLGTTGTLNLPAQFVAGEQIIGLNPTTETVAPAAAASYDVELQNPTAIAVTYTLSVQGVPARWINLASSVPVAAGATVDVPFVLTSDSFAATGDYGFSVTASGNNGADGSVQGDLVLQGQPTPPDTQSHGVVATLTPAQATAGEGTAASFTVAVTNTGSATDTFALSVSGLPTGFTATLAQPSVTVPPGAGNFVDVSLVIVPPLGTAGTNYPFTVTAASTTLVSVKAAAAGTVAVVTRGVQVTLNPSVGQPGGTFQMTVKNTGNATDTFKLALAGPASLAATLAASSVTLAAGASTVVNVSVGQISLRVPGQPAAHRDRHVASQYRRRKLGQLAGDRRLAEGAGRRFQSGLQADS